MSSPVLPPWLEPLPAAAAQRELDRWAIEDRGISGSELMERAGAGLAEAVSGLVPDGKVVVVCGKGNNGGDGLVAARLLREREPWREVSVLLLEDGAELKGDAALNLSRLGDPAPQRFSPEGLRGAAAIVDAILGTGFSGEPREPAAEAISVLMQAPEDGVPVIACDVPSGVDASTGEVVGPAVRATATVTFHAAKPGLWIHPGKAHAGEITVVDIGIPAGGPLMSEPIGLLRSEVLAGIPRRQPSSTKFSAGAVLVCGGSLGLTGAPTMAARAAARAGAGYVTVAVPASLVSIVASHLLEVMQVALPETAGVLNEDATRTALERTERVQALVLGPGLGRQDESLRFARDLARQARVPLVLDADGLNAHAGRIEHLSKRFAPTVMTPHAGELARLLQTESRTVEARRLHHARLAADRARAVVVLKGDDTLVAEPEGRVAVNPGGSSTLATAGTGDVLAGVIAALLGKGMEPFEGACAGVHLHSLSGQIAAERIGREGVIAGDVIELLPAALDASEH